MTHGTGYKIPKKLVPAPRWWERELSLTERSATAFIACLVVLWCLLIAYLAL